MAVLGRKLCRAADGASYNAQTAVSELRSGARPSHLHVYVCSSGRRGSGSERFVHNVQEATALKEQRLGRGRGEVGRWLGAVE